MPTVSEILNFEFPEPAFSLRPSQGTPLPSSMTFERDPNGDNGDAYVRNRNGIYVNKGTNQKRVAYDKNGQPGLLVEATSRTNYIDDSSEITTDSTWSDDDTLSSQTEVASILDEENAYKLETSGNVKDRIFDLDCGPFSSNEEVLYFIIEESSSSRFRISIDDEELREDRGEAIYEWGTGIVDDTGIESNARLLTSNGPNGGRVVQLEVRYDPTTGSDVSGNTRRVFLNPDRTGTQSSVIAHHAQLEEASNASSPIVTQGSAVTRGADNYSIFEGGQPSWWNPNEGTIICDLRPQVFFSSGSHIIIGRKISDTFWFYYPGLDPSPFEIQISDGDNIADIENAAPAFESTIVASSVTPSEIRISANGQSDQAGHNGNLLSISALYVGGGTPSAFGQITYIPKALPESTLNTLTS